MPAPNPTPPESDRVLGLEFYLSDTPGLDGRLKATPEEFRVSEISLYPLPDADGPFTVLRVRSRDWEQHELAGAIARRLHLPPHAIAWAGTKDRRAVAERLFSYRGALPVGELDLPRVELIEAYRARDGLVLGHHYGNAFEIRISDLAIPADAALAVVRTTERALRERGGFPNLFGPQRFGEVRPVTHRVGREVVRGDLVAAVETYLADLPPGRTAGPGDEARRAYSVHHDPRRALAEFPPEYRFERTLLDHLAQGHGPDRALRGLSRELRLLFVHAFQSLLFNRWVSRRRSIGLPLDLPVAGDRILRVGRDGTVRALEAVPVATDNLPECEELVRKGRALLAGPLVGFDTPEPAAVPGELLASVLSEEGVDREMFRTPHTPELASRGAWRPVLLPVPPLGLVPHDASIECRFSLPKGAYATVLLREFLKAGAR